MQAVILAAGLGRRIKKLKYKKPKGLLKIAGREIIYRNLKILKDCGIEEFILITNPQHKEDYERFLKQNGFKYKLIINPCPERGNGYSFYLSKDFVSKRFVLLMSDHLYEEKFIKEAIKLEGLIVDKKGTYIQKEEATKVVIEDGRVKEIGKNLSSFQGFDTGFFILTPEIFKVAENLVREKEIVELSEIIKEAKVSVSEVNGYFWMDIDTPEDVIKAKCFLIKNAVKDTGDGWISKLINRKISTQISYYLVDYLTPNQATLITFLLGILSVISLCISIPLAGILYQISSILDGVDGEIARASMRTSKLGGYIDSMLDRYIDFFFVLTLAIIAKPTYIFWIIIAFAIFGSLMVSYSTERYKASFFEDAYKVVPFIKYIPGKRDERIFLITLFCIFNKILEMFILLAILTNLRVLLTLILIVRNKRKEVMV